MINQTLKQQTHYLKLLQKNHTQHGFRNFSVSSEFKNAILQLKVEYPSCLHCQVSSAAQDVRAAKWNQRSKEEWNWVIFMYYSKSTFCRVLLFRRQPRWIVSLSRHSCHGRGEEQSSDNWFYTLNLECYADFICFALVWDIHCQNLSCAKETESRQNRRFEVKYTMGK